jgi:hypothetical protein
MSDPDQATQFAASRLSLQTLRLLHKYLDDFVLVGRAKAGTLSSAELKTRLFRAGAPPRETELIIAEYARYRTARHADPR